MASSVALACANAGAHVAWIAPTYKNSRPLWRMAERLTMPVSDRVEIRRAERTIDFPSGGAVSIYSADNPTSILGESFDLVILDEAARIGEDAWTETILPTLADRNGRAMLISTPKGRNWFWREYMRGVSGEMGYASFTAPTADNPNPNIKRAAQLARDRVPERIYRQEWLAEFIDDGGGVFQRVRDAATAIEQKEPDKSHMYVAGLDWALSGDYTVLTVMDATIKAEAFKLRMTGIDYSLQRERIKGVCQRWNVAALVAEDNGMGRPNNELLRSTVSVQHWITTNTSKANIIESLSAAFERGEVKIINDEITISELEAFESERLPGGAVRYAAPHGMHDDTVMSLALAWQALSGGSGWAMFAREEMERMKQA